MNSRLAFLAAGALLSWLAASWYHGERLASVQAEHATAIAAAQERLASVQAEHATAIAAAQERHRATERGWQAAFIEVSKNAEQNEAVYIAQLGSANDELARLREASASRASRAASNTDSACRSTPASGALILYSELLDQCAGRVIDLAGEADRRRIAGQACEAAHDALRGAR